MTAGLADMHVHTSDSPDADIPARELALRGIQRGLSVIGFVAHFDLNPDDYCYDSFDPAAYDRSVELAVEASEGKLEVLKGLEVGEPHRFGAEVRKRVAYRDYDFVTGALHSVENAGMILGAEAFEASDPMETVEEYYRETLRMAETAEMDILAHMGLFRRGLALARLDCSFDETGLWPDLLRRTLNALIERGIALELNTSGLRRKEGMTYPTPEVLELYRGLGGELVTLGSDTHRESHLFHGLAGGMALLREKGFGSVCIYRNRKAAALAAGLISG